MKTLKLLLITILFVSCQKSWDDPRVSQIPLTPAPKISIVRFQHPEYTDYIFYQFDSVLNQITNTTNPIEYRKDLINEGDSITISNGLLPFSFCTNITIKEYVDYSRINLTPLPDSILFNRTIDQKPFKMYFLFTYDTIYSVQFIRQLIQFGSVEYLGKRIL